MHRIEIARYLASKIDDSKGSNAQNIADTLRALADKVDSLERSLVLINADCMRLAMERDEVRLKLEQAEESCNGRRETVRSLKPH